MSKTRGKCQGCGLIVKFPYYAKGKFRFCKRCGAPLILRCVGQEMYLVQKHNENKRTKTDNI